MLLIRNRSAVLAHAVVAWLCTSSAVAQDPFSIVLLPDTQNYAQKSSYGVYAHQTQWIADHRAERNIQFVVHLGDITQHDTAAQWNVASQAHQTLDQAGIPYSVTNGNHDLYPSAELYLRDSMFSQYFGPSRFAGESWYGGAYDATNENNYTLFEADGIQFMVLSLEFLPRKDVVTWANQVIQSHPNRRVIVVTHCYLQRSANYTTTWADGYNMAGREGLDLWEELVQRHSNIFMVVSGHIQGVSYRQRVGLNGNVVHEVLTDFQSEPVLGTGTALGNGWLRVLTFDPAQDQIEVETLSVEDGNFAIFDNGAAELYLSYNQIGNPTPTQHNLLDYTLSYDLGSMPAYAYSVGDMRFKDRLAHTVIEGGHDHPRIAAAPNGNFVVVWQDDHDGNGVGQIYARAFDADGNALFGDKVVNSVASGQQRRPDVAVDDAGNFVVVWEDDQDGNGSYQILARGFYADGSERFSDRTVNSVGSGQQFRPAVAADANGDFVVAWEDDKDGNGYYQILARGFTASGSERIADFTVNSAAAGQQFNPAVGMDGSGDFVVAWEDDQDNNGYFQVYARGFTRTGANLINDFRVNTNASGQHAKPAVALDADGDFVVAWEDDQDNNGYYQIYARGFTRTGAQRFGVFTVNSTASGQQYAPAIAMDAFGDFVVFWEDDKDGNGYFQILGRSFYASSAQRQADFTANSDSSGQQSEPAAAMDDQARFILGFQDDIDGDGAHTVLLRNFLF